MTRRGPRVCCVLLPQLPLQILLKKRPYWLAAPVAVVNDEGPNGRILHLNREAMRSRLRVGMSQGPARDLVPTLHTAVVPPEEIANTVQELIRSMQTFSPRVEPNQDTVGAFFVDPEGLRKLYGGYEVWSKSIYRYLRGRGWQGSVVVGFQRHRCLAIAHRKVGAWVLPNHEDEQELSNEVSLRLLGLSGKLCEELELLGIETLGDFMGLPAGELQSRLGTEASDFHALFEDGAQLPIQPHAFEEPVGVSFQIDPPDSDHTRLLFAIKGGLHSLLHQLASKGEALKALRLRLKLELSGDHCEMIEPAKTTTDVMLVLELVRLRLATVELAANVEEVELTAVTERARFEQERLAGHRPRRNVEAGSRALARVRAAYGTQAVARATLQPAHLPEAGFRWEPISHLPTPRSRAAQAATSMVRRVYKRPKPLPPRLPRDPEAGPALKPGQAIERFFGPYRISGGWWKKTVERDYYYAETDQGDVLWVYFDRPRKRWFLHGVLD